MARDYQINGPCLVTVKGRGDSAIGALSQLGLADGPIQVTLDFRYLEIKVDAWGDAPPEIQCMLAGALIGMNLVHFDEDVLEVSLQESLGSVGPFGTMPLTGARLGNNLPLFAPGGAGGNHFISVCLTSPVWGRPWHFPSCYMVGPPASYPLGTERSVVPVQFRAIPYTQDPYGGGLGALGTVLWNRTLDV